MCIGNGQLHDAMNPSVEVSKTLNCLADPMKVLVQKTVFENHSQDTRYREMGDVCQSISATYGMGGNNQPFVVEEYMENKNPILLESNQNHATITENGISTTLSASMGMGGGYVPMITDNDKPIGFNRERCGAVTMEDKMPTIQAAAGESGNNQPMVCNAIVRRLTPLECERLQGYPDGWVDIGDWIDSKGKTRKGESDSPKYKALGNSIALPFWQWMADRMVKVLKNDGVENPTMASLFDGISGFCLVYKRCGCEPVWVSEVDEFPIAVTTKHFGDEDKGIVGDIDKYL